MTFLYTCLLGAVISYLVFKLVKFINQQRKLSQAVQGVPGPKPGFLLGNSLEVPLNPADWTEYFCNLGTEFRAKGRNCIPFWNFTDLKIIPLNGEGVKDILESNDELTKSNDYDIVLPWLGTGLLISTGAKWRQRRRMLTPTFHFKMLDGYVNSMDREAKLLTEILAPFAQSGEKVDLFPYIRRCALDIICDTAMGVRLGSQTEENHPYALAVEDMCHITNIHSLRPWLWFKPFFYISGWGFKYDRLLKTLTNFTKEIITERSNKLENEGPLETSGERLAFLDMLLAMRKENSLSDEDIREEVDTFMFEGHDTTSSGMAWIVWALATHPDIQNKVAEELHSIFADSDREITVEDLKKMEYLDRVIKESMRVNPPVPLVGRRLQKGLQIGDVPAPPGSQVLIASIIIHRNEQVYPDPEKFDPDRFLPENMATRNAYDYIPFSAGPRNCIGQKFAMYEEKLVIAWLIRKFEISTDRKFEENRRAIEVVLKPDEGIKVTLKPRTY